MIRRLKRWSKLMFAFAPQPEAVSEAEQLEADWWKAIR
jgi:hypothetical protein